MNKEEIKHLAKLSEIEFSDKELSKFEKQFDEILNFVSKLQSVDTENIEPLYHPIENTFLDVATGTEERNDTHAILENSPHRIENETITIKSATVEH